MNILATICARGGSKRTPGKNMKMLAGKPLIAYTIEVALQCKEIERVIVSTDDKALAAIAKQYGAEVPFIRPKELAIDTAPKLPVIQHAVNFLHEADGYVPQIVVDLDPTSPLRRVDHVSRCIEMLVNSDSDIDGVVSVYESGKNPYFNMVEYDSSGFLQLVKPSNVTRGQDAPIVYSINGSLYAYRTSSLMQANGLFDNKLKAFVMEPWAIDIDTPLDFEIAEFLIQKGYLNRREEK